MGWITDANGCDIWQGGTCKGYGRVRVDGQLCYVSRVRYEREIGPIPEGLGLDHFICDNGAGGCCNPFHCRPASQRGNVLRGDSPASANAAKTHCPEGHPLSGENLTKAHLALGHRACRICRDARKRAAHPTISNPSRSTLERYVKEAREYSDALQAAIQSAEDVLCRSAK